ncbi:MAG: translation initiation factor IF-2 [Acidobacteria bacterium]|nr:MAG: translation initiation factor IF-2 [Acidobacteriota bacterium]
MGNVRVFQLARDLNLSSQEVIDRLKKLGVDVKTASSSVDEDTADKLKRALKIDAFTARKKRIYGSDEDEAEREQQQQALAAKIAAEQAERARAAAEATAAAEARKNKKKGAKAEKDMAAVKPVVEEPPPALLHAPGAPRLAPKVATPPPPPELEEEEGEEAEVAEESVAVHPVSAPAAAPPAPPAASMPAMATPAAARPQVVPPRPVGPLRPIAPPAPPAPPAASPSPVAVPAAMAAGSATPVAARATFTPGAAAPRPVRPIAPARPIVPPRPAGPHPTSPHPVAGGPLPRSPHPVAPLRPLSPLPGRPGPPPMNRPVGRPSPKRQDRAVRGIPAPVVAERPVYTGPPRKITLTEGVTVKELGEKMEDVKSRDIIKALLSRGIMATVNQTLDPQLAIDVCKEFGYEASIQSFEEEVEQEQSVESKPEDLVPRAPVITVMGHVDHGKTSLLDAIRETSVAAGEAGGITQHIGAYHVDVGTRKVVFLDTPGHEAFTLMRARGAKVTDIVVLVVAADDGVMPQTVEAIDHAKAAAVPIVVAVNKIDKPEAQPDRVKQQLSDHGLMPEEWGGNTVFVSVSAKKRQNLEQLLEMLLLVADLQELKANPKKPAAGTVLESRLDKGRGPVATVLVQDGTLHVSDTVVAGAVAGKIRALADEHGQRLKDAGPATPVEVLGLPALPEPGDPMLVVTDSAKAQQIVGFRQLKLREKAMSASSKIKLEDLGRAIAEGQLKELPLVVKADVQGSVEAVVDQLMKIPQDKIKLRVIRSGAGAITEGDVLLAAASNAVVIGFNVRPERKAADAAERDKVELRLYTVIYDAVEDIKKAMEGLLEPTIREVRLGAAEVREAFRISRVGTVAGCYVTDGRVHRGAQVRLLRDNVVIHTGKVSSLKRFKDDVTEVKAGLECGIGIANYNDIKPGDVIEFFTTEKVKETLE